MITHHPVKSSNITHLGYDYETNTLHVTFKSGGVYTYKGVTPNEVADLAQAPSIGSHLSQHIKPKYTGEKLIKDGTPKT